MNIVNLSPDAILYLAEAATRADAEGKRLRVAYYPPGNNDFLGSISFKVGEDVWSAPFRDQPDPYRDNPGL